MAQAGRVRYVQAALALSCTLAVSSSHAQEEDAPEPPPAETPATPAPPAALRSRPTCPSCCQVAVEVAPRFGISINDDQWLFGSQLRTSLPCLGNLEIGPLLTFGVGGNHFTVRSSGRLDYMLWFNDSHVLGVYPAVGASVLFYLPVGHFATFCHRVDLDECAGYEVGGEIGGGLRYRSFAIDAFAGFAGLPAATIMAAMSFPLGGPEVP